MSLNRRSNSFCKSFRIYSTVVLSLFFLFLLVHGGGTCGPGRANIERKKGGMPALELRSQVPDADENSIQASGKANGRVKRGTAEYDALITNTNPDIIFKEDVGTGDNRRMTKRCGRKLADLVSRVRQYWHGKVKVKVIRAYDDGEGKKRKNDPKSLHYEGRAVDITTSDSDRKKYAMLGRLAIDAGFDWVKYPSRAYIHASVKSEEWSDNKAKGSSCFHSSSSVQLQNGKTVQMKDLRIGDQVASLDAKGRIIYSPVIMFFHRDPNLRTTYLTISTHNHKKKLLISPTHFIYNLDKHSQHERVLYAKRIAVGDDIYIRNSSTPNRVTTGRVTAINVGDLTGAYAPLTETGNMVVDDVVVSCYAVFPSNTISHWSMFPIRILARFFPNLFETEEEIPWYPRALFRLYSIVRQLCEMVNL